MSFYCLLSNHRASFSETFAFYSFVIVLPYYRKLTLHKKNDFEKKEIKKTQNLLRRHEQSKTCNFVNVRGETSEEIWPLRGIFAVALFLADFQPDKIPLFLSC